MSIDELVQRIQKLESRVAEVQVALERERQEKLQEKARSEFVTKLRRTLEDAYPWVKESTK